MFAFFIYVYTVFYISCVTAPLSTRLHLIVLAEIIEKYRSTGDGVDTLRAAKNLFTYILYRVIQFFATKL